MHEVNSAGDLAYGVSSCRLTTLWPVCFIHPLLTIGHLFINDILSRGVIQPVARFDDSHTIPNIILLPVDRTGPGRPRRGMIDGGSIDCVMVLVLGGYQAGRADSARADSVVSTTNTNRPRIYH